MKTTAVEASWVFVRNIVNAHRRDDQQTTCNNISCIWLEIRPEKGKSILIGNMYRPPDSRVEFNKRFENFIDKVLREEKR